MILVLAMSQWQQYFYKTSQPMYINISINYSFNHQVDWSVSHKSSCHSFLSNGWILHHCLFHFFLCSSCDYSNSHHQAIIITIDILRRLVSQPFPPKSSTGYTSTCHIFASKKISAKSLKCAQCQNKGIIRGVATNIDNELWIVPKEHTVIYLTINIRSFYLEEACHSYVYLKKGNVLEGVGN